MCIRDSYTGFGGSSIDLVVRFWSDNSQQGGWMLSRSRAIMNIKLAFEKSGIEIPYPIRTLDLSMSAEPLEGLVEPLAAR